MELWQLKQRQSLCLELKIVHSKLVILKFMDYFDDDVYLLQNDTEKNKVLCDIVSQVSKFIPLVYEVTKNTIVDFLAEEDICNYLEYGCNDFKNKLCRPISIFTKEDVTKYLT